MLPSTEVLQCFALLILLCGLSQSADQPSITIEVERDVRVQANRDLSGKQERGVLYLSEQSEEFLIKKGEQFEMVAATGAEGSCQIRFRKKVLGITSCPWLDGFTDHQADIFRVIKGFVSYTNPEKSK